MEVWIFIQTLLLLPLILGSKGETVSSGELQVNILKEGRNCDRLKAEPGDILHVHYVGRLDDENGKIFDSSKDRGQTFNFKLGSGQVIRGYEEGVPGMCEGGKRTLRVPPSMAYGEAGVPAAGIPPNAVLHFTVELMKIIKEPPSVLPPRVQPPEMNNEL